MPQVEINLNSPIAIAIQNSAALIANISNQYIVSQSGAPAGISGFVFDVIDIEEIHLQSDATDHYIETGSAVQDHVVQHPIEFTLKGFVGELKNIMQAQINDVFYQVAGLGPLTVIAPNFNIQDAQAYTEIAEMAAQAVDAINALPNVASIIPQLLGTLTYQQQAYSQLYSMWVNDNLCTVQTPFGLLTNMLIIDMRPSQSGDTRLVSGFNITFKQITMVNTVTSNTATNPASPNPSGAGTQSGNYSNGQLGGAVSQGNNPNPNYPSSFQFNSGSQANAYADLTAPTPSSTGSTSQGMTVPNLSETLPQNNQIFSTLPSVVTPPVAPLVP